MIVKYRQGGVTTLYEIDELDEALWVPGMSCAIIAHEAKKLPEYFNIVKLAFENLPDVLKPKTKTDTKMMYEFTHLFDGRPLNSSIYVATDVRGGTVQRLHITESAYIRDRAKMKASSKQAVPKSGFISEETTGNGFNQFYDEYMEAYNNKSPGEYDYKAYFYAWVEHPEYSLQGELQDETDEEREIRKTAYDKYGITVTDGQILWRRWKVKELSSKNSQQTGVTLNGAQLFKQEYPLTVMEAFQSGAGNVFDQEKVDAIDIPPTLTRLDGIKRYPGEADPENLQRFNTLYDRQTRFWELPESDKEYVIGVDPSDGEGSDNGCIDVWSMEDEKQVAQFYGKARPDELAELAAMLGYLYNEAFIGIENNMIATVLFLSKIYTHYYYSVKVDQRTAKRTKTLGWSTNTRTRDLMIDDFIIKFEEGTLTIRSPITINEMKTFVKNEQGKREHATGKHDDALFAGFIAMQMKRFHKGKVRVFAKTRI